MSYFVLRYLPERHSTVLVMDGETVALYPSVLAAEEAQLPDSEFTVHDFDAHMANVPKPAPKGTPVLINGNWVEQG